MYVERSHMAEIQFSLVVYTSSVPCFSRYTVPDLVSEVGSTFSRTAPANTSITKPLLAMLRWIHKLMASTLKRPELNLTGNISENFKNFEIRFNDYCVQVNYRNPETEPAEYYKNHSSKSLHFDRPCQTKPFR